MTAKHHYVPRFYLEGFIDPTSSGLPNPYIWVADLEQGTLKKRAPETAARITGYYNLHSAEVMDKALLEKLFSKLESSASIAIRNLRDHNLQITAEDRFHLSNFVGIQFGRVPAIHQIVDTVLRKRANEWIREYVLDDGKIGRLGKNADFLKQYVLSGKAKVTPQKEMVLAVALQAGLAVAELIFSMRWTYIISEGGATFFTSDNPVGLLSPDAKPLKIDFSEKNENLEISFSISPSYALLFHRHEQYPDQDVVSIDASTVNELNRRVLPTAQRYLFSSTERQGQWILDQMRKRN